MYTHIHTNTQWGTCTDNRNTTKNIHHIIAVHDITVYTYYDCNFNTNNNNTTQFDEYSSYRILALVSHVDRSCTMSNLL